jgi:hypothetical protein
MYRSFGSQARSDANSHTLVIGVVFSGLHIRAVYMPRCVV